MKQSVENTPDQNSRLEQPGSPRPEVLAAEALWAQNEREAAWQAIVRSVEVWPEDVRAWEDLRQWSEALGRREAALEVARAQVARPGALPAALLLFDLQLAGGDLDGAAQTLAQLRRQADDPFVLGRAVQLAAARRDLPAAESALRRVGTAPCPSPWPVEAAVEAMVQAGWRQAAEAVLEGLLVDAKAHEQVGRKWVDLCYPVHPWYWRPRLDDLVIEQPAVQAAAARFLDRIARDRGKWRFRVFFGNNKEQFRKATNMWSSAGYALLRFGRYYDVVYWMGDWPERADVRPWMLMHLVLALRRLGRDAEAEQVSRRALGLPPDGSVIEHRVWLAVDAALKGDADEARRRLREVAPARLEGYYCLLRALARAVVDVADAEPAAKRRALQEALATLHQTEVRFGSYRSDRALRRLYRRTLQVLAALEGTLAGRLTYWRLLLSS